MGGENLLSSKDAYYTINARKYQGFWGIFEIFFRLHPFYKDKMANLSSNFERGLGAEFKFKRVKFELVFKFEKGKF